jgi:hypothetical protein
MFGKKKKEKKKKQPVERFISLKANGTEIQAINFSLNKNEDGSPRLEVRTREVTEALHYEHIDFELKTSVKLLKVGAVFREAVNEKHFKVYIFDVDDFSQFYI